MSAVGSMMCLKRRVERHMSAPRAATKLILDTDFGAGACNDVDDVGTLCMLNALADRDEVELLAIVLLRHD